MIILLNLMEELLSRYLGGLQPHLQDDAKLTFNVERTGNKHSRRTRQIFN